MTEIIKKDEGKRVELVYTSDPYTKLKPGDKGTYKFLLSQTPPMQSQHCIEWDSGSTLMLLQGVDSFKFIELEHNHREDGTIEVKQGNKRFSVP